MEKVSIIIPIYNVAKYIRESLMSAFNQTYVNIEYVIVDDCGTDASMAIVAQLMNDYRDRNVKIVHHKNNQGLSIARNTGVINASGEFIFFMDSDDVISPNCIQYHVDAIIKYNADFTDANIKVINGRNRFWRIENDTCLYRKHILNAYFQGLLHITACNKLYRKSFITQSGLSFVKDIIYEDTIWVMDICLNAKKVAIIPEYTYNYIIHSESITTTCLDESKVIKQLNSWVYILNYITDILSTIDETKLLCSARKWVGGMRFNISSRLITLHIRKQLKYDYYKSINSAGTKQCSDGLLGRLCDLPFSLFYILFYIPRYLFDIIKKYY